MPKKNKSSRRKSKKRSLSRKNPSPKSIDEPRLFKTQGSLKSKIDRLLPKTREFFSLTSRAMIRVDWSQREDLCDLLRQSENDHYGVEFIFEKVHKHINDYIQVVQKRSKDATVFSRCLSLIKAYTLLSLIHYLPDDLSEKSLIKVIKTKCATLLRSIKLNLDATINLITASPTRMDPDEGGLLHLLIDRIRLIEESLNSIAIEQIRDSHKKPVEMKLTDDEVHKKEFLSGIGITCQCSIKPINSKREAGQVSPSDRTDIISFEMFGNIEKHKRYYDVTIDPVILAQTCSSSIADCNIQLKDNLRFLDSTEEPSVLLDLDKNDFLSCIGSLYEFLKPLQNEHNEFAELTLQDEINKLKGLKFRC